MLKDPRAGKTVKYKNGTAVIDSIVHNAIVETRLDPETGRYVSVVKKNIFSRDDGVFIVLNSNKQRLLVTLKDLKDIKSEEDGI